MTPDANALIRAMCALALSPYPNPNPNPNPLALTLTLTIPPALTLTSYMADWSAAFAAAPHSQPRGRGFSHASG